MILRNKKDLNTNAWSGGTTTELFIYPEGSSYAERNFSFRNSTSTVDDEKSVFTCLPGVQRHIMVLDGEMELVHDNQPAVKLDRLKPHSFDGGWETISFGRCTDFNLMTRESTEGNLKGYCFLSDGVFPVHAENGFSAVYLLKGSLVTENNNIRINAGDFLILETEENIIFKISGGSEFVLATIKNTSV